MRPKSCFSHRAWLVVPVAACAFVVWAAHVRRERAEYVSGLVGRANTPDIRDAASPTGYADGQRELIIPERNEESFQWITQAQQMFSRHELRVRHVDYENAPNGHGVSLSSPYRWWIGVLALADRGVSARPIGMAVEHAALYADPAAQVVFLLAAALLAAFAFGPFAAALVSAAIACLFPLSVLYLPGMPFQQGFADALCALSLLLLCAGCRPCPRRRPWFIASGVVGALALWASVPTAVPLILGAGAGALLAACQSRRDPAAGVLPWRAWGLSGGVAALAAYLVEYFPGQGEALRMDLIHPFYGLAWIGMGELLERISGHIQGRPSLRGARAWMAAAGALALVACVPVATRISGGPGFQGQSGRLERLTWLPGSAIAPNSRQWLAREGASLGACAVLGALLVLGVALWLLFRRSPAPRSRAALAVAVGPAAAALVLAAAHVAWWSTLDITLAVLAAAGAADAALAGAAAGSWALGAAAVAACALGAAKALPAPFGGSSTALTAPESGELVERHLAHWLERRTGTPGFVVYAPPLETTTLCFFGGLKGIGTFAPDNRTGFGNGLTIAGAQSMQDLQTNLEVRGVRYIVMPSWDPFFDDFGRLYLDKAQSGRTSLLAHDLRSWNLPPWLQPVPYQLPVGGGFEGQSILVFQVVDPQGPAVAASRIVEYLVEMGDLDAASTVAERLRRFPGDVGAIAARAQLAAARDDSAELSSALASLDERLAGGGERYLAWDRRVSLAVVLARAERYGQAAAQIRRCSETASEADLRLLSTGSLYDFLVLAKSFHSPLPPALRDLAVNLLPVDLRGRL